MWRDKNKNASDFSERDLENKMKNALSKKDLVSFKRLLKGGVDVNAIYWFQSTLLHEATQMGSEQFVEVLLKANANVDSWNKSGRTPLHIAARSGNLAIVKMLLKNGANVNGQVQSQAENSSSVALAGQTPLHVALWRGRDEVVKLLLENGADVNALDQDGWMAIHWAAKLNYVNILKELIRRGSYIDKPTAKSDRTPLIQTLINSNSESAQILLVHGANVNKSFEGKSALSYLLEDKYIPPKRKLEMIQLFLDCGLCHETFKRQTEKIKKLETQSGLSENYSIRDSVPQSLSHLCRIQIREHSRKISNGKSIYCCLQELPLPKVLLDFVTFSDCYKQVYDT